ncbi:AsnC family transcriptional regulator [Pandoraea captiosa]|uniref:AsnC family transcriptional regulator n=1 Tax=Pandoraea captiosa TaxID=2508302 RepID=A0A5E5ASW5_9BURK|nr:Lrp/AsnC family transcriptional regulator [Pandoraea captiosa]VVE75190.1 AsnC family transcriptional regulator [Pandoraea captiosa]
MVKLDRFDLAILRVLAREGRITKSRLAELIHLSVSPTWERVQRLETAGVIRGYRADIDWSGVVQVSRIVVEITLARHTAHDMQRFESRLREAPEVVQCHATGGGVDYIVHVLARDIDHYQRFIDDLLMADFGIERYFTYIVTKVVKDQRDAAPGWIDAD